MEENIKLYNENLSPSDQKICTKLSKNIDKHLPYAERKIWHAHPVWFLDGNPIVGYSNQKKGIRLMFWSGASFEEELLEAGTGKFKDASIFYASDKEINADDMKRWLEKSKVIQWDYKNVVKSKGVLVKLGEW